MKRATTLTIISFLFLCAMLGCNSFGKRLEFNKGELYYTSAVTEDEAKKLGNYLVIIGYFADRQVTVQLDKSSDTYQVRFVVQEGGEKNEEALASFKLLVNMLSKDVFNGAKVEIHLCNDKLKTIKVVKMNGDVVRAEQSNDSPGSQRLAALNLSALLYSEHAGAQLRA
ncbi:MAG: hypothetical protein QOC96_2870 [Acidobacteriota bacterium]|jgi:hypothetical protein|nr:hypothetical protein [Acidobacteriota bacterium]